MRLKGKKLIGAKLVIWMISLVWVVYFLILGLMAFPLFRIGVNKILAGTTNPFVSTFTYIIAPYWYVFTFIGAALFFIWFIRTRLNPSK